MDERDLSAMMHDGAPSRTRSLDLAAIEAGIRRRRRTRRAATGAAAASLVLIAAVAGFAMLGDDDADQLEVITPAPDTTIPPTDDTLAPTVLDDVELWQLQGRYVVYGSDGISWLVDGHLEQVWGEPVQRAYSDGSGGVVFQDRPADAEPWFQQRGAIRWLPAGQDVPTVLVPDDQFAELHGLAELDGIPSVLFVRWLEWPELDTPVAPGSDATQVLFARSFTEDGEDRLGIAGGFDTPMRWAAQGSDGLLLQACHLTCAIHGDLSGGGWPLDPMVVEWDNPSGLGVTGLATAGEVIATVRYEKGDVNRSENPALGLLELDGIFTWAATLPDLGLNISGGGIDLDLAPDGSAALIRTLWSEAPRPPLLVRGVGTDSPTVQNVLTDQALRFAPDAPASGQGPPPNEVDAEDVALADLEGRFLVFGSDGIAWLDGGVLDRVWLDPVDEAYPDGSGGIVFQERGILGEGTTPPLGGAIRWLPASSGAIELVPAGTGLVLRQVVELDGEPSVLFTRREQDPGSDLEFDEVETLFARGLTSPSDRALAETGYRESSLDAIDMSSEGLVLSACHLQCTVRLGLEWTENSVIRMASWITGLAAAGETLAVVEWDFAGSGLINPVLALMGLDGETHRRVPLPQVPGKTYFATRVELSPDAGSAVVINPSDDGTFTTFLVTGLVTGNPTIQVVTGGQALRFG